MSKERFKYIVDAHLFLIKDDKILLLRRANTGYEDGNYGLPAGHLDGNETVREGLIREAKEEACLEIAPEDLEVVHSMYRKSNDERISFFLLGKKWTGEPKIGEPDKCSELTWFPINDLPSNTIPYIKSAIEKYNQNIFYSEHIL